MTLDDLCLQLRRFTAREIGLAELHAWMSPILAADSLDIEESADPSWDAHPEEARLLWRLVYMLESGGEDDLLRVDVARIIACHDATRHPTVTHELLPLLLDQDRLCGIVAKHVRGVISRTGFLNVIIESGYPEHIKLWLEHAPVSALERVAANLTAGAYGDVAQALERRPA